MAIGAAALLTLGCSGGEGSSATATTTNGSASAATTTTGGSSASTTTTTTDGTSTTTSTTTTSTTTDGGSETASESETGGSAGDPALQVCRDLPEAAAAMWIEGPAVAPSGDSTPARIADAGAATWELAVDLLKAIPAADAASIAASPTSMSIALGMTTARHSGTMCETSMLATMHAVESGDALHNTFGASILEIEGRALPMGDDGEDPVVISLKQSLWELMGRELPPSEPNYGATRHLATGDLEAVRAVMNCVIDVQSQGLLPEFIPGGYPKPDTSTFDATVAYVQAPWRYSLSSRGLQTFNLDGGGTVDLDMIGSDDQALAFFDHVDFDAVSVPLRGDDLAVLLVLPDAAFTDLESFTAGLTADALANALADAAEATVDLTFPKFKIAAVTVDYYEPLDLECELFTLRTVLHSAAVEIDEKGVKAAAATLNEGWVTGTGPPPLDVTLTFDRPFLFFVYDGPTGLVLYSGRYAGD